MNDEPPSISRLACDRSAPRLARDLVTLRLLDWSAATYLDVITLLVSELVSETVSRTSSVELTLRMQRSRTSVRITVEHNGPILDDWTGRIESQRIRNFLTDHQPLRWGSDTNGMCAATWFEMEY